MRAMFSCNARARRPDWSILWAWRPLSLLPPLLRAAFQTARGASFSLGNPKFSPSSLIRGGKLGMAEGLSMALFIKETNLLGVCQGETALSPATNYVAQWLS